MRPAVVGPHLVISQTANPRMVCETVRTWCSGGNYGSYEIVETLVAYYQMVVDGPTEHIAATRRSNFLPFFSAWGEGGNRNCVQT
jgi:hypothetical protein